MTWMLLRGNPSSPNGSLKLSSKYSTFFAILSFSPQQLISLSLFFKGFIYLLREEKGGRKRRRETSMCDCLSHAPYWAPGMQLRHMP